VRGLSCIAGCSPRAPCLQRQGFLHCAVPPARTIEEEIGTRLMKIVGCSDVAERLVPDSCLLSGALRQSLDAKGNLRCSITHHCPGSRRLNISLRHFSFGLSFTVHIRAFLFAVHTHSPTYSRLTNQNYIFSWASINHPEFSTKDIAEPAHSITPAAHLTVEYHIYDDILVSCC